MESAINNEDSVIQNSEEVSLNENTDANPKKLNKILNGIEVLCIKQQKALSDVMKIHLSLTKLIDITIVIEKNLTVAKKDAPKDVLNRLLFLKEQLSSAKTDLAELKATSLGPAVKILEMYKNFISEYEKLEKEIRSRGKNKSADLKNEQLTNNGKSEENQTPSEDDETVSSSAETISLEKVNLKKAVEMLLHHQILKLDISSDKQLLEFNKTEED